MAVMRRGGAAGAATAPLRAPGVRMGLVAVRSMVSAVRMGRAAVATAMARTAMALASVSNVTTDSPTVAVP